jgi:hypothetical protein
MFADFSETAAWRELGLAIRVHELRGGRRGKPRIVEKAAEI